FFFCQAEDGIRDRNVTGVQTCALPILLGGSWDYERMTFDFKYEVPEGIYYLRMPGYTLEGDVGANNAILQLMDPYMGKHYYPTGIEYGADEHFPDRIVDHAVEKIRNVVKDLKALV